VKDDRVYLEHIRDALDDIAAYASAGREAFFAERMRQDATIRKLQVIGQQSRIFLTSRNHSTQTFPGNRSQVCATMSSGGVLRRHASPAP
jgi:uncharacterized protein with HEPN domain